MPRFTKSKFVTFNPYDKAAAFTLEHNNLNIKAGEALVDLLKTAFMQGKCEGRAQQRSDHEKLGKRSIF